MTSEWVAITVTEGEGAAKLTPHVKIKTKELAHLLGKIETSERIEQEGSDVFIMLYDGASEWTYWDGKSANKGRHCNSHDFMSQQQQLHEAKGCIVTMFGERVKDARLHVSNHRDDRTDWFS